MSHTVSFLAPQPFIKLLTEREVAILIRKSVYWLRRKRWEGGNHSIPYRKLGGSVRYAEIDVLNWITEHAPQTSTSTAALCKETTNHLKEIPEGKT